MKSTLLVWRQHHRNGLLFFPPLFHLSLVIISSSSLLFPFNELVRCTYQILDDLRKQTSLCCKFGLLIEPAF